jgi:hypothetical protein
MALIISDANIVIDVYAGDILPDLFQLAAQVGTLPHRSLTLTENIYTYLRQP